MYSCYKSYIKHLYGDIHVITIVLDTKDNALFLSARRLSQFHINKQKYVVIKIAR